MATLVSDIIRDAYRESNLISIGTEPSGAQRDEGIRFINRLIPSVLGYEGGENLSSIYDIDSDSYDYRWYRSVLSNGRIVIGPDTVRDITLPDSLTDGSRFAVIDPLNLLPAKPLTLRGGRNTVGGAVTLSVTDDIQFLYRADLGNWQKVTPVVETDVWPFPAEFDDMFIITLAFRLNPRYNIASQSESLMMLKRSEGQFRSRYRQSREMPSDLGLLNLRNAPTYNFNNFDRGSW